MSLKKVRVELTAWGKYQRFSYYENGYPRINILSGIDEDISDDGHDWLERIETTDALVNQLPVPCKNVLNGKYVRMWSVQKIAVWLSMPIRSVEFRLMQGERELM
jgi:DNA-directed RNA polymerase specialized sigma24 family protein